MVVVLLGERFFVLEERSVDFFDAAFTVPPVFETLVLTVFAGVLLAVFADVLLAESAGPLEDRQREYVSDVADAGRHLLALIDDLLELARLDAIGDGRRVGEKDRV